MFCNMSALCTSVMLDISRSAGKVLTKQQGPTATCYCFLNTNLGANNDNLKCRIYQCLPGLDSHSRQSAKPFLQSLELGLPQPLTRTRVFPLPLWFWGERHTRWRERGWESPNSDEGKYTVVLFIGMCFVA